MNCRTSPTLDTLLQKMCACLISLYVGWSSSE
jgi:hypothetical protein